MRLYLYNTSFTAQQKERNYSFYEPRTIHESSLSPSVHSILAAELGKMEDATTFRLRKGKDMSLRIYDREYILTGTELRVGKC